MTGKRAPSVSRRKRSAPESGVEWLRDVRTLALQRAARDAHCSDCLVDELYCDTCRMRAARIAEAMVALQRDPFEEFGSQGEAIDPTFSDPIERSH